MKNITKFLLVSLSIVSIAALSIAATNAQSIVTTNPNQICYAFNNNLLRGSSSQDVFNLQTVLIKENLLHIAQPTYWFGPLTLNAVIAFQNQYASTVLSPIGLSHGTGYVGLLTREKLNALYGCGVSGNPVVGPGQHCGGNIANAPVCQSGYSCAPIPGSTLPFGDVGGICVINNTNQSPVISGISGPTTLGIGQTGTWSITASDPQNNTLSYSVVWGDVVLYPSITTNGNAASNLAYSQTATFTHSYNAGGTYTPIFYVRDVDGNTVSSSLSVNVGNQYTNQPTIQYLQPNYGTVGSTVTIIGSGFTPTGNRIKFGNLGNENNPSYSLNSYNGTAITFTVPYSNYVACLNSVPSCMIAQQSTQPGTYPVAVINSNGTSNQIMFTVTSSSCVPNWQCGWGPCNNGYQSMVPVDENNCGGVYQGTNIACPALARTCN